MRSPDELLSSGLEVIEKAYQATHFTVMLPLFSGGHDSLSACYVASQSKYFQGNVVHINTGIGSIKTRQFVENTCKSERWNLRVLKSLNPKHHYELLCLALRGFPGPAMHSVCYNRLKQSALKSITKSSKHIWGLISGMRSSESSRRMHREKGKGVPAWKVGNGRNKKTNTLYDPRWIWISPCYDWSSEEQKSFIDTFALPLNPVKLSALAMSGECCCGAFARPNELEIIREVIPDVADEIDRISKILRARGFPNKWGYEGRIERAKLGDKNTLEVEVLSTGPMCSSCDMRASTAGIKIVNNSDEVD